MQGVLLYAHDNGIVDYAGLACACARMVHANLKVPVALVTDRQTRMIGLENHDPDVFDLIIETDLDRDVENWRTYHGTEGPAERGKFLNASRSTAYELSPWSETLLIDLDYLVFTDRLNAVWGSDAPIRMNCDVASTQDYQTHRPDTWIDPLGIPLYWATVVYFRKDEQSKLFFDILHHVEQNYVYYGMLYRFSPGMFRNDFTFSVAAHILSDYGHDPFVRPLPYDKLLFAWDREIVRDVGEGRITFESVREGNPFPIQVKGRDIHVMNKRSLLPFLPKLVETNT